MNTNSDKSGRSEMAERNRSSTGASSSQPDVGGQPWKVGEFWSSANPGKTCLVLSAGSERFKHDAAHESFIRWVGQSETHPAIEQTPKGYDLCLRAVRATLHAVAASGDALTIDVDAIVSAVLASAAKSNTPSTSSAGPLRTLNPSFEAFQLWASIKYPNRAEAMHVMNSYAYELWQDLAGKGAMLPTTGREAIICSKCGADRATQDCLGDRLNCGITSVAHTEKPSNHVR